MAGMPGMAGPMMPGMPPGAPQGVMPGMVRPPFGMPG